MSTMCNLTRSYQRVWRSIVIFEIKEKMSDNLHALREQAEQSPAKRHQQKTTII